MEIWVDGKLINARPNSWNSAYHILQFLASQKEFSLAEIYYDGWCRKYTVKNRRVKLLRE